MNSICRPLHPSTKFLLDNTEQPKVPFSFDQIYEQRRVFSVNRTWPDGGLLWDHSNSQRQGEYMPLGSIEDFLDQFNFVGYHDICNYFQKQDVEMISPGLRPEKGFARIFPGYTKYNGTGQSDKLKNNLNNNYIISGKPV